MISHSKIVAMDWNQKLLLSVKRHSNWDASQDDNNRHPFHIQNGSSQRERSRNETRSENANLIAIQWAPPNAVQMHSEWQRECESIGRRTPQTLRRWAADTNASLRRPLFPEIPTLSTATMGGRHMGRSAGSIHEATRFSKFQVISGQWRAFWAESHFSP